MKIRLGLDLDGVCYDWHTALHTYYQYIMGYAGDYRAFWTEFFPSLPKSKQEYIVSIPIPYDSQVPSETVTSFLDFAKDKAEIYYITSRLPELESITRRYIKRYDFPFQDNLIFSQDKASSCSILGITHFLDDFARHVIPCSKVCNSYLMNKLWNLDAEGDFTRVYGLGDFREKVFGE